MNQDETASRGDDDQRAPGRAEPTLPGFEDPDAEPIHGRGQLPIQVFDEDHGGEPTRWRNQLTLPGSEADRR